MTEAFNIADLRLLARKRLQRGLFEYVDRGSEDERALANNRDALARIRLQPRVLVDVRKRKLERVIFDKPAAMPIAISPTAVGGMLWYDGDVLAARAAAAAGIPYTLSTASVTPIERVAEHGGGRLWFQLYVFTLREHMRSLIDRARAVNCEALVVTVDTSMVAKREYNQRNGFGVPIKYTPRTIVDVGLHPRWLLGGDGALRDDHRCAAHGALPRRPIHAAQSREESHPHRFLAELEGHRRDTQAVARAAAHQGHHASG